jgi:hypothetical protein
MSLSPPRHIPSHFPVLAYVAIIISFVGVFGAVWWLAITGVAMLVALFGVVVKREFFDDNTPDYYDYNE